MRVLTSAGRVNLELNLELESTLQELPLWKVFVEVDRQGNEIAQILEEEPLLPGIILTRNQVYVGMISRRKFFEHMSRPFSLGLFSGRPIEYLHNILQPEAFELSENMPIVKAAQMALQRSSELIYDPILVKAPCGKHGILDFQQLLLAYSQIQTLTQIQLLQAEEHTKKAETNLYHFQQNYIELLYKEKINTVRQVFAGVAQKMKNPIDFLTGNLIHTNRLTQELLHLVKLYQLHYPNPEAEIQSEIKKIELDVLTVEIPKLLDAMKMNSKSIQCLLRDFHQFYEFQESEKQKVNINDVIDITLLLLQSNLKCGSNREKITIVKDYGNLPPVNCYAWRLNRVFTNILNRAINALEERMQNQSQFFNPQIKIKTEIVDSTYVVIHMSDNGFEMNADDLLFATKTVGHDLKLGLSASDRIIVEEHGGQLQCISTPEHGTEFIVKILSPAP
jgi:signal transduction histidine kinase